MNVVGISSRKFDSLEADSSVVEDGGDSARVAAGSVVVAALFDSEVGGPLCASNN